MDIPYISIVSGWTDGGSNDTKSDCGGRVEYVGRRCHVLGGCVECGPHDVRDLCAEVDEFYTA